MRESRWKSRRGSMRESSASFFELTQGKVCKIKMLRRVINVHLEIFLSPKYFNSSRMSKNG